MENRPKNPKTQTKNGEFYLLLALILIFFIIAAWNNFRIANEQQYIYLAQTFLQGHLNFSDYPGRAMGDIALYQGRLYWPLSPLPAIILLPFVWLFDTNFLQGQVQFFSTILTFWLAWRIALKFNFARLNAAWLAFAFCFSSVYLGIAFHSWSWYFTQSIAVTLLLWAVYEYLSGQRWWLIGMAMALVSATRYHLVLLSVFFILLILFNRQNKKQKIMSLVQFCLPIVLALGLLFIYNYLRFDNGWETGENFMLLPQDIKLRAELYGLFSISNFWPNLYKYFFALPFVTLTPSTNKYWALDYIPLNFWVVSPIFLWLWKTKIKQKIVLAALGGALPTLFAAMLYFSSSIRLGPRLMVDILPLLFLILLPAFPKQRLKITPKIIIAASAVVNVILFFTIVFPSDLIS